MFRPQGTLLQKERGSNQGLLIFGGAPLPPRPPQNGSCLFCPISWVKVRRKFRLLGICPLRVKQGGFSFKFTEILPGGNFQSHTFLMKLAPWAWFLNQLYLSLLKEPVYEPASWHDQAHTPSIHLLNESSAKVYKFGNVSLKKTTFFCAPHTCGKNNSIFQMQNF